MAKSRPTAADFLATMAHYIESLAGKRDFTALLRYYDDNRGLVEGSDEVAAGSILRHVATAQASLSNYRIALRTARLAQNILARHGDNEELAEVYMTLAGILRDMGKYKEARVAFQDAESIFRRNDCLEGQGRALNLLAGLYYRQSDYSNALNVLMDAIAIARKSNDQHRLAYMVGNIGRIYTFIGNFSEAVKHLKASVELTRKLGNDLEVGRGYLSLGYVYIQQGDFEHARHSLQSALSYLEESNSPRDMVIYMTYFGELEYRTGHFGDSESLLSNALRGAEAIGTGSSLAAQVRRHLAELYLRMGDDHKTGRQVAAALKTTTQQNNPVEYGALLKIRAALADRKGQQVEARKLFDQAFEVLGASGVRFEKAEALIQAAAAATIPAHRRMTYLFRAEEFFSGNRIPLRLPELQKLIKAVSEQQLDAHEDRTGSARGKTGSAPEYLTANKEIERFRDQLPLIAKADMPLLLTGETGVGKDHLAKVFHSIARPNGPFRTINCASVPETLLESELFGYRKGAFTGADSDKDGLFVAANGGVLFLDEIGEMPLNLQSKLLLVIEERQVTPLGSTREVALDVKVVTATNCNLDEMVESGKFRRDLYYRLCAMPFHVPPLRDRKEDIPMLVEHFMRKEKLIDADGKLPTELIHLFLQYEWPGNVRELENMVKRLKVMTQLVKEGDLVELTRNIFSENQVQQAATLFERVEQFERDLIVEALLASRGNKSEAARMLGIHEATVRTKLKRYGIDY